MSCCCFVLMLEKETVEELRGWPAYILSKEPATWYIDVYWFLMRSLAQATWCQPAPSTHPWPFGWRWSAAMTWITAISVSPAGCPPLAPPLLPCNMSSFMITGDCPMAPHDQETEGSTTRFSPLLHLPLSSLWCWLKVQRPARVNAFLCKTSYCHCSQAIITLLASNQYYKFAVITLICLHPQYISQ